MDIERLKAILIQFVRAVGHKGKAADRTDEVARRFAIRKVKLNGAECVLWPASSLRGIIECLIALALPHQSLAIDIGNAKFRIAGKTFAFSQQIAKFIDHPLPIPSKVGRAFAITAGGVHISGYCAARLRAGE